MTTSDSVVIDASAALRGYLQPEGSAGEIVDDLASSRLAAYAPDLFVPEVANALRVLVNAERWPVADAAHALQVVLDWPIALEPCLPLAASALETAANLRLSAHDAFYAVLASALGVPLVTADRRLAAAVAHAVLVA